MPDYWPWTQVLRTRLDGPAGTRTAVLGPQAQHVSRLIPERGEQTDPASPPPSTARGTGLAVAEAVATVLLRAALDRPLLVVLDDLHLADESSLLVLRLLAPQLDSSRLLVVGTYRDGDVGASPSCARLFERFAHVGRRIMLGGLDEAGVTAVFAGVQGQPPDAGMLRTILTRTEGNPLFVKELASLPGDVLRAATRREQDLRIPDSIRRTVVRRIGMLPRPLQTILRRAAVLGRRFSIEPLREMAGCSTGALLRQLDRAAARGVLQPDGLHRWTFTHALVHAAIYEDMGLHDRARLHRAAGEALERVNAGDRAAVADMAHHFFQAARIGSAGKAVDYCELAAEQALESYACVQAARLFGRALQALDGCDPPDVTRRLALLERYGQAQRRSGALQDARHTFRQALDLARSHGRPEAFARCAVGLAGLHEYWLADHRVTVLREALVLLPGEDVGLRSQVLVTLAAQHPGDRTLRLAASDEALRLARQCRDPAVLIPALSGRHLAIWDESTVVERVALASELERVARSVGDDEQVAWAQFLLAADHLEAGDVAAMDVAVAALERSAAGIQQPYHTWLVAALAACRALLAGDVDVAEPLVETARRIGEPVGHLGVRTVYATQVLALRRQQGRFAEMATLAHQYAHDPQLAGVGPWSLSEAVAWAELGRVDEARRALAACPDGRSPTGEQHLPALAMAADACWLLRDTRQAESVYELLMPYAGRLVVEPIANAAHGSSSRSLGLLATLLRRWDEARAHFDTALELECRTGSRGWLAHSRLAYAQMLRLCGASDDTAATLVDLAHDGYRDLGLTVYAARADALRTPQRPSASHGRRTVARKGQRWTIEYHGTVQQLPDTLGMRYLARLLAQPGRELLALDLYTTVARLPASSTNPLQRGTAGPGGHTEPVLDAQAKDAYRRRLRDLRGEHDDAVAAHDPERAHRTRREIDFLVAELRSAVGLGGRDRNLTVPDSERARQSVTKAIRSAIDRIAATDPDLGEHLRRAVRTGTYVCYAPYPPVSWMTDFTV
jgi:tetratricopeptide (TPR) repeat protein